MATMKRHRSEENSSGHSKSKKAKEDEDGIPTGTDEVSLKRLLRILGTDVLFCGVCWERFTLLSEVWEHVENVHVAKWSRSVECGWYGCRKAWDSRGDYRRHMRSHTGERPYVCDFYNCRKAFSQNCTLTEHKRTHTGERPFACGVDSCDRSFQRAYDLTMHEVTHHWDDIDPQEL